MKRRTIFKSGIVLSLLSVSITMLLLFSANFGHPNLEIDSWIGDEYKYWGTFMIHSEVSCDKLRRRTVPVQNTIALGCAFTTKDSLPPRPNTNSRLALFRQAYDMLPFFNIFLWSFCETMSSGFRYKIFVAYDYDDYYLNDTVVLNKFKGSFNLYTKRYCSTEGSTVELQMVYCGYSGKPAWSQNDALMKAYEDVLLHGYRRYTNIWIRMDRGFSKRTGQSVSPEFWVSRTAAYRRFPTDSDT